MLDDFTGRVNLQSYKDTLWQWKHLLVTISITWCFILCLYSNFCTYNPTTITCGMEFYNHHARVVTALQGCEHLAQNTTTSSQPCYNLTKLWQGCYNFHMGTYIYMCTLIVHPFKIPISTPGYPMPTCKITYMYYIVIRTYVRTLVFFGRYQQCSNICKPCIFS